MEFNKYRLNYASGEGRFELADLLPFKSVVWEESYNGIGKMQAVFPKTLDIVRSVTVGSFASIQGVRTLMYVHSVKLTDTELWAYGYEAKALLQKQGMMPFEEMQGEQRVDDAIRTAWELSNSLSYCDDTPILPRMSARNLDALEYYNLYEFIRQCCELEKAGFVLRFAEDLGTLNLSARVGQDVSDTVRFATAFGNASGVSYTIDDQSEIYEVIAVGDDNGTIVYAHATGSTPPMERTRAFLDCRQDFPKPDDMTSADYLAALETRAHMSQIARSPRQKVEVKNIAVTDFGVSFLLGDIVGIEIPEYNISAKARITTMRRTIEGNLDKLTLDLSTSL